ncbi:MAG: hypothetical protein F7B59_04355 [Desulfurococcales archaeon]|nr:hypothetical protein [Desulfurococcales archaeon]
MKKHVYQHYLCVYILNIRGFIYTKLLHTGILLNTVISVMVQRKLKEEAENQGMDVKGDN